MNRKLKSQTKYLKHSYRRSSDVKIIIVPCEYRAPTAVKNKEVK